MKAKTPWVTYRTRFLVKARQLTASLTFTDALGRQHSGRKGDYLVESSDGVLRIAPRQIFEDIYVPLAAPGGTQEPAQISQQEQESSQPCNPLPLRHLPAAFSLPSHLTRKSPQPDRDRRNPSAGLRSL
jgi:hypothetical protein